MHTLQTLQLLGLDPASASARRAIALVAENGRWEHAGQRYFDGEVEPCINGRTIETGAYFGVDVAPIVERILDERLEDGGWNCEAENGSVRSSFDTTINVLDGLLRVRTGDRRLGGGARRRGAAARSTCSNAACSAARARARSSTRPTSSSRSRTTGTTTCCGRSTTSDESGAEPDPRMAEAVEVVRSKRQPDGRWLLDRIHPGRVHFDLEGGVGTPSRWNTLRALRVLDWWAGTISP